MSFKGIFIWFLVTLFVFYAFFLNTAGAVFSESIKTHLHASDVGVAYAVGSFIIGFALMQIPGGYLLDKFNMRWVVSSGVFLLALGNLTLSYSNTLFLFSLSNFIQGLGASFAFLAAGKLISEWFAPNMFPIMFGLTQSLSCIFAAIIHYYLVLALETISWQSIYQELALFGFTLTALILLFVKSPNAKTLNQSVSLRKSLSSILSTSQIWLCSFGAATSFGVLTAYASFWYIDVQKFYNVDTPNSLIISGMVFVGIGIGTPILGWLSNKVKSRNVVIHTSIVLGAMLLLLGIYLPHFNDNTLIPTEFISFCIGFFLSGAMLYYTCVSELSENSTRGVALGLVNTLVFLFNSFLLFLPRLFITETSLSFFTYLWILPFCVMISVLLAYFVKETYKQAD